ncbi:hypothetical protein N825_00575 [Skermanella stibiiresistens SB22]|uniref:Uncharacterized protein n=1 Tax=Skermanella stibiiresistens SB22 TaxID=1385369 RepID=W9H948_9PROT|nr:hypothetical protein [Skermanella stibiiresistens]EWY42790.1 hypothetical protein N825_00575 [Skermanella stibiiresistens SB22]
MMVAPVKNETTTMTETAPPFTTRLAGDYVPATFEERGATVPFQKPDLANARVRRNARDELEVLVYGFSGGRGIYVLAWRSLPDLLGLNLHDLTLHAEILTTKAVTPERVQIAAYRVARSGLAGETALQEAEDMLADRAEISMATTCDILRRLVPAAESAAMTAEALGTPAGKAAARATLAGLNLGTDPDAAFERIQKTASLTLPLGVDAAGGRGPLRTLFGRVGEFTARVEGAGGDAAALIADIARLTLAVGGDLIQRIDAEIAAPAALLAGWDVRSASLKQSVDRLGWLLDGWRPVCDLWDDWVGAGSDPALGLTTLRILPLVPRNECGRFQGDAASLFSRRSTVYGRLQDEA